MQNFVFPSDVRLRAAKVVSERKEKDFFSLNFRTNISLTIDHCEQLLVVRSTVLEVFEDPDWNHPVRIRLSQEIHDPDLPAPVERLPDQGLEHQEAVAEDGGADGAAAEGVNAKRISRGLEAGQVEDIQSAWNG